MEKRKGFMHEGHRSRMYEKLKKGDDLYAHELLEMLLFNAYPRKNTNPVAHALLQTFGTISGVLNADVEELVAVDGVGESVALYLKCVGECVKKSLIGDSGEVILKNYRDFKNFAALRLRGKDEEMLEFYCLQKNGKVKRVFSFTDNEQSAVEVKAEKLANILVTVKPHGLLIAHNHLSGNPLPSENDDLFTMKAQTICSMNNVLLYDHCIYAPNSDVYSYFISGRIDKIIKDFSLESLVGGQYKKVKLQSGDED